MTEQTGTARRAGAFDIRVFIGSLIGLYGAIVLLTGLFGTSDADIERAGGLNINITAGVGMLVAAAVFIAWARLRPVVVAPQSEDEPREGDQAGPGGHSG